MDTSKTFRMINRISLQEPSREQAIPLRVEIEALWDDTEKFELDFAGIEFISVSFLDELVAKLFLAYDRQTVMRKVIITNLANEDRILLGNIVNSRIRQRQQMAQPA